jgi:hypothetical protein
MKKIFVALLLLTSCVGQLPDCESVEDVMIGAWVIDEVFIDNIKQESESYAAYRLQLEPNGSYLRDQPSGLSDAGSWLMSSVTTFALQPNISPEEQYLLESFTLREMVLVLNRNSSKAGPSVVRYVLKPEAI